MELNNFVLGKLINEPKECKCCNNFTMKPMRYEYGSLRNGHGEYNYSKNIYQCQNCFAEFEAVKGVEDNEEKTV